MTAEESLRFKKAQWRFILCSMIAYAFFYLTRKNLSMAQPIMLEEGVVSTYAIGTILTIHGVLYGVSRFVNGFWADRLNGRVFMTVGLSIAVIVSLLAGFVPGMSGVVTCSLMGHTWTFNAVGISSLLFGVFWIVNAWAQGMGFPPCAKMLTHWIHPKELATKMSIWNTSHSFGAVMALGLCSLLLGPLGLGWRWCFWVPAALAACAAVFCFFCVKDSPTEAGVEELEIEGAAKSHTSTVTTAERRRLVFGNKVIWFVAIANFFVYIVRFGFLDWGPTFLKQFKGIPVSKGGLMTIAFELAAVIGTIFAGWVTDKVFKGRGVRTCVFCMLFASLFSFGFWRLPNGGTELQYAIPRTDAPAEQMQQDVKNALKDFDDNVSVQVLQQEGGVRVVLQTSYTKKTAMDEKQIDDIAVYVGNALKDVLGCGDDAKPVSQQETEAAPIWLATLLLMGAGFCIYGPQALIGIVAANQATKEAAAMANGFTGIMGYASTTVSGIGIAFIKVHFGWGPTLGAIAGFALVGMVFFLFAWNANATGYKARSN